MASRTSSMNEILPNQLYLGTMRAAASTELLTKHDITHVVSVCSGYGDSTGPRHKVVQVADSHFENLLRELPDICEFIQQAIDEGGRVLVHCELGMSRSASCVVAYLMKSKGWNLSQALRYVKEKRPSIHPNDGFLKQLEVFQECGYSPTLNHPAYMKWMEKHSDAISKFKTKVVNVISIIPNEVYFSSGFPRDKEEAVALLYEFHISHIVEIAPSEVHPVNISGRILHSIPMENRQESFLIRLPQMVEFIGEAIELGGKVLVHCVIQSRPAIAIVAYLMAKRGLSKETALEMLHDPLPLWQPTDYMLQHLTLFEETAFQPTVTHPAVRKWSKQSNYDCDISPLEDDGAGLPDFGEDAVGCMVRLR